jgi:N-methylhydantoinase B
MSERRGLSRIEFQVMWNRLLSVVEEQAQTLIRTAFSTTVREAGDVSAGVFDLKGRMLAQAVTGTPGHVNSMAEGVNHFIAVFPLDTMKEGDVYLTNDPWISCGHLHDFTVVTPVFLDGSLLGLMASTAHVVDVGGRGLGPDGRQLYEEGLQIPVMALARGGELNQDLIGIIRTNVREPDQVVGDIIALLACNEDGGKRLCAMAREFGLNSLDALGEHIVSTSYAATMKRLAELPFGSWQVSCERDGYDFPVQIVATMSVSRDGIHVDYTGTSGPSKYGINVVLNYTTAYTVYTLKCILASDIPNNAGSLAPFTVSAPPDCILNAQKPWPLAARHIVGHMVPDVVMGCIHQALPGSVPAESAGAIWNPLLRGGNSVLDDVSAQGGEIPPDFTLYHFNAGGIGARPTKDGLSTTAFPSGVTTQPVEAAELVAPIIFWRKELRSGSGGAGRFRGGLGQVIEIGGANGYAISNSAMYDRVERPAAGRVGGHNGATGRVSLTSGKVLPAKGQCIIPAGDRLRLELPGGAGYGDPLFRDPTAVLRDFEEELISAEEAQLQYGVVIGSNGLVDRAATERLRSGRTQ